MAGQGEEDLSWRACLCKQRGLFFSKDEGRGRVGSGTGMFSLVRVERVVVSASSCRVVRRTKRFAKVLRVGTRKRGGSVHVFLALSSNEGVVAPVF